MADGRERETEREGGWLAGVGNVVFVRDDSVRR